MRRVQVSALALAFVTAVACVESDDDPADAASGGDVSAEGTAPEAADAPAQDAGDAPALLDASGDGSPGADGGSPPADASTPLLNRGGRRLQAIYLLTADGTALFRHFFDRDLQIPCRVEAADDGKTRCVPFTNTPRYFKDTACKEPVELVDAGCAGKFGFKTLYAGRTVYKLGPPQRLPAVYSLQGTLLDQCAAAGEVVDADFADYVEPVPAAMFAEFGPRQPESPERRITGYYQEGLDGSRARAGGLTDKMFGGCGIAAATDGTLRCLPIGAGNTRPTFYADSGCTQLLAFRANTAAAGRFEAEDLRMCPRSYRMWQPGPDHTGPVWRMLAAGGCEPVPAATMATLVFRTLAAEVPPSEFERFDRLPATGRIDLGWVTNAAGTLAGVSLDPVDRDLDTFCWFGMDTEGNWRCFPGLVGLRQFADSGCSTPGVMRGWDPCSLDKPSAPGTVTFGGYCRPTNRAFWPSGTTVPSHEAGPNGKGCVARPNWRVASGVREEIPAASLVQAWERAW